MIRKYMLILSMLIFVSNTYAAVKSQEIEVARTAYKKDQFKYYILEVAKKSSMYNVTLKRQSHTAIKFFKVQLRCTPRAFRELGSSEKSATAIKTSNVTQWYQPVIGSIEVDVITQVCRY